MSISFLFSFSFSFFGVPLDLHFCFHFHSFISPHSLPIQFHCTHFYFHFYPMTNLLMRPQIAIVPSSVFTISTITFHPSMLLLHMIHGSVGDFSPKSTFSADFLFPTVFSCISAIALMSVPVMLLQASLSHEMFPTPRTHSARTSPLPLVIEAMGLAVRAPAMSL